jgi:hypothetical protein
MPVLFLGAFAGLMMLSAAMLSLTLGWCAAVSFCVPQGGGRR